MYSLNLLLPSTVLNDFIRKEYVVPFASEPTTIVVTFLSLITFICVHFPPLYCSMTYPEAIVLRLQLSLTAVCDNAVALNLATFAILVVPAIET